MSRPLILIALIAALALAVWQGRGMLDAYRARATFDITNRSDEEIFDVYIEAFGRGVSAGSIPPGESRVVALVITGEGSFKIDVTFASGRKMSRDQIGYLTSLPMKYDVEIRSQEIWAAPPAKGGS